MLIIPASQACRSSYSITQLIGLAKQEQNKHMGKINKKKWIRSRLLVLALVGITVAMGGIFGMFWFAQKDLPNLDALKDYQPPQSTVVYDRNQRVVGRFFDERRTVIPITKLPRHVVEAFVAAEDGSFFEHHGLDYLGIVRAVILEIKYRTIGGRRVGGSTITQQTARAMLLTSSQTYMRKIKDILLARRIEQALSKDQILHLYLNQIYFGNGAYGIEEAALTYFFKPAAKLELFEAAALASIPKSPNRINPFGDTVRLKDRQAYVLEQMLKLGFIDEKKASAAKNALLFSASSGKNSRAVAPYFLSAVRNDLVPRVGEETIRKGGLKVYSSLDLDMQVLAEESLQNGLRALDKRNGFRGPLLRPNETQSKTLKEKLATFKEAAFLPGPKRVWDLRRLTKNNMKRDIGSLVANSRILSPEEGLIIGVRVEKINQANTAASIDIGSSIIELPMRGLSWARPKEGLKKVSDILEPGDIILVKLNDVKGKMWASLEQLPQINGGLVALDVETGGVLAMVGGYDFDESPFNRIMQAKRQPGSGMKPLIYAQAIDRELVTPATIITDTPKAFFDPGTEEYWRPRNHTNKYLGDITVRHCLRSSINTCTITLLEKIGIDSFLNLARDVELIGPTTPFPRNLTIALGSAEIFPINLANSMRLLAHQGRYSPYHLISKVKLATGAVQEVEHGAEKQLMRPEAAYIVTNILQGVISSNNREKYLGQVLTPLAGKTGTTNNVRSTWFFGYSPKVLALVFIGYDDNRSIGATEWGVTTAFPIWARFMNGVKEHHEPMAFLQPENLEWRTIDSATGQSQDEEDPNPMAAQLSREVFIRGTAPAVVEDIRENTRLEMLDNSAFAP